MIAVSTTLSWLDFLFIALIVVGAVLLTRKF